MQYQGLVTDPTGHQLPGLRYVNIYDEPSDEGYEGSLGYPGGGAFAQPGDVWWIHIPANGKAFQIKIMHITRCGTLVSFLILKRET